MTRSTYETDPRLDLVLERVVDVPPELVWKAWTSPEHVKKWFTPAPWKTVACEIDLRPGGAFLTTMQSPEGESFPNVGCYLEVVPGKLLVWTNALQPGFRPRGAAAEPSSVDFVFTAFIMIEPHEKGTKYTARVLHSNEKDREAHEKMGFHDGWGAALDQLVALMKKE